MISLRRDDAEVYVPDGADAAEALARTTHLGIGAHQDDLEIMAIEGILACYEHAKKSFAGVVVTDGRGSPRAGAFKDYTDDQMQAARAAEQKKAADIGKYGAQILLNHPSDAVKTGDTGDVVADLRAILEATTPEVVYTHNPMDKHDAHVGVTLRVIEALRALSPQNRPKRVLGCEVWRDLDWLPDDKKVVLDCSINEDLQLRLLEVFESQIAGGKRYDLAAMGRRRAHATYHEAHAIDASTGCVYAVDLTPLIEDDTLSVAAFAESFTDALTQDVRARLGRLT